MGGGMNNDEFTKLCELFGFAPSRALRELLEAVEKQAFHDANINAAATILDAAVLEEREACAKVCERQVEDFKASLASVNHMEASTKRFVIELVEIFSSQCAAAIRGKA